jgi:hypothetical protein
MENGLVSPSPLSADFVAEVGDFSREGDWLNSRNGI